MLWMMESPSEEDIDQFLISLYRNLLRRDPDRDGFANYRGFLNTAGFPGFSRVVRSFVESPEFKGLYNVTVSGNALEGFGGFDFSSLGMEELNALFEKTATYWRGLASSPEEIYWSVLTDDRYRGVLDDNVIKGFLETGRDDVSRIKSICEEIDFAFDDCREYLEYGCGVGRLVVNLPSSIQKINCVDFSSAHLCEAEVNLRRLGNSSRYEMHEVESLSDLAQLPSSQDIIHSFLVLQHNTPPVMEKTVASLLELLSSGGIAILHIPIAKVHYSFDVKAYLSNDNSGQSMEMHILPKSNLFRVARESDCAIVYSYCAGGCGGDIYSEILVFQKA